MCKKKSISAAFLYITSVMALKANTIKREINIKLIVSGCLKGNRSSQQKMYSHFYGYALSIALRFSKNREEAVEIMNDAFLKVFKNLDKYDTGLPFKTWLRRIIINAAIDYHRRYHKNDAHILPLNDSFDQAGEELPMPEISPDEDMLPILQRLPPTYRMVFNLYVMEDYKHYEIAELLDISVSTSRSNLVRAKEKLRQILLKEKKSQTPQNNRAWKIS